MRITGTGNNWYAGDLAGKAKAQDLPTGNWTSADAGLSAEAYPVPDGKAFDAATSVAGVDPYPHLGADPDCLVETPPK